MSRNIGNSEQVLRLAIGVALIGLALLADFQFGWALLVFGAGIGVLATAFVRYCPVNTVLRRDSTKRAPLLP